MDFYAKLISKDAIQLWVKKGLWPNGKDPYLDFMIAISLF